MGVRSGFWKALQPYARLQGMGFLHGRRVAVDLSSWIVSAMSTKSPTLRNIFFRTLSLFSKMGAFPVFVLDGVPSPLKAKATSTSEAFTRCVHECVLFHEEHILDELRTTVKRIKIIHGNPHYLVQWRSHADDRMFLHTDEDVQLVDEAFPNEARWHKWLKGRVKSGANRNQLLVPNAEKSRANNMSKTPKGAGPRPSWMQLSIKDFYRSKKPHVEMGETSTRKSSPVSQRRRLLLG
ncbi:hypothetical protein VPH35_048490 [Triticum aestivum]